jgi:hypothetical protein
VTDDLRAHALGFAAHLLGDRRGVEIGDEALPTDAEAVLLTEEAPDPGRLRGRLERARDAAAAGTPVIVYVATSDAEHANAGAAIDPRKLFDGVSDAVVFEQRAVEYSLAQEAGAPPQSIPPGPSRSGTPDGLMVVANLPVPNEAEARLFARSAATERRRDLERRLATLRTRNLELARSRLGAPVENRAASRARVAERRLLFARVRETVSALLSRRRLRG